MYRSLLILSVVLFGPLARATSPAFGASMAITIAQQMLSAPPLPSLERGSPTLSPQYGYVSAEQTFTEPLPSMPGNFHTEGRVSGNTAGLSLAVPTKGDFGFFLFGLGARISGESTSWQNEVLSYKITEVKADTYAVAGGISYRLLGTSDSLMALGLFGGPAFMKINSTSTYKSSGTPTSSADFSFDPSFFGAYWGLQTSLRLWKFVINPYAVSFLPSENSTCQEISSSNAVNGGSPAFVCDGQTGKIQTYAGFSGIGLFLGYGSFRLNVYSNGNLFDDSTKVTSYSASIGIGL